MLRTCALTKEVRGAALLSSCGRRKACASMMWLVQANGVQNEPASECTGLEVTSAFTANVWEV